MSGEKGSFAYRHAVLALNGDVTDPLVIRTGVELARGNATRLTALHVIEATWRYSLDEEIPGSHAAASTILDIAEAAADRGDVRLDTQLLQAREVGAALVDEAVALEADVIVLGLPYRKRRGGDFALGRTIPYVFQNAPMTVLVVREPVPAAGEVPVPERKG